jgi:hypothetical protein
MKMNRLRLRSIIAACGLFGAVAASAATINVSSISSLQTAINGANPGDTIVLANGAYSLSSTLNIARAGTSTARITIKAASVGGASIGGTGGISFASPAAFVTLDGFVLTHSGSINIPSSVNHITISRNVIDLNIAAGADVSYINISGDDVEIARNELKNKNTLGEMLDIAGSGTQVARRLWVHHNYFHDFTSPGGNGAETIRWGLSGLSLSTGAGICEYNLFVRCTGENELISNKSSGNTYRFNTFIDNVGGEMSQRHGNNNLIYGNYFRNSQGIRIFGDGNQIFCNYLEGNSNAINIGNGDGEVETGAALTSHDKPDDTVIVFNTLINNTIQYEMGGRTGGLGADHTTFANNIIQGGPGDAVSISTTAPYSNAVWSGNIIWNAPAGDIPSSGYTTINPMLAADADGVFHLQSGSPAIGSATGSYSAVTVDMDGQPRPVGAGADKGADEFSAAPVTAFILTASDVGPNSGGTASAPSFNPAAGTFTGGQSITITSATSGATIIYTTDGSTPSSSNGTVYTGPVGISVNTTLKAIATKSGLSNSSVTTGVYNIRAAQPVFTPAPGTYTGTQNVSLSSGTSGVTMRYTLDGTTPSQTNGTVYSGPVVIATTATLKAIAYKTGLTDSLITSGLYTINTGASGTTITSADGFVNNALATAQSGSFTATFDLTPSISPANQVGGLSSGAATAYTGIAVMVRFNTTGTIDARNGGAFTTGTIPFSANTTYHFRVVVNVPAHTYSAFVTAPGGSEQTIGTGLAFRTEQAAVTSLNNATFNVNATPGGSLTFGTVTVSGSPTAAKFSISGTSVTASADDGNVPANTVDGSLATRWSASGDGQWIMYDLGATKTVTQLKIAFYSGDVRTSTFDVQVASSATGPFTTIATRTSSGTSLALETFDVPDTSARFVRYLGHGNSANLWNSLAEVEVWGF